MYAIIFAATLLLSSPATANELTGRASVIDGDTIEIHGERIRLHGIDAPESRQQCETAIGAKYPCGRRAAEALDTFLAASRPTRCDVHNKDRYGRSVATCYTAAGANVAAWLVENGHALDWPRYSKGAYASHQSAAKQTGAGIWQGAFTEPWAWRRSASR